MLQICDGIQRSNIRSLISILNLNPFHSQIDVVEIEDRKSKEIGVFLWLHVQLGFVGSICSYEEVFYVDSKCHVLIYGLEDEITQSLRVAWFEKNLKKSQ